MALRDTLTQNLGWKVFSLVLAAIIWLTVKEVSNDSTSTANPLAVTETGLFTNLPVLVVSSAADVREFKVQPNFVSVVLSAKPEVMATLQDKDIHISVDLSDIEAAHYLKQRVDVSTPAGVTLVSVTPPDVDIVVPPRRSSK